MKKYYNEPLIDVTKYTPEEHITNGEHIGSGEWGAEEW